MPWEKDLRRAQQTQVAVDLTLYGGEHLLTGVHAINDDGTVSFYDPWHLGDDRAARRVRVGDIASLAVTEIKYEID